MSGASYIAHWIVGGFGIAGALVTIAAMDAAARRYDKRDQRR
jgi:hypothetical protein